MFEDHLCYLSDIWILLFFILPQKFVPNLTPGIVQPVMKFYLSDMTEYEFAYWLHVHYFSCIFC